MPSARMIATLTMPRPKIARCMTSARIMPSTTAAPPRCRRACGTPRAGRRPCRPSIPGRRLRPRAPARSHRRPGPAAPRRHRGGVGICLFFGAGIFAALELAKHVVFGRLVFPRQVVRAGELLVLPGEPPTGARGEVEVAVDLVADTDWHTEERAHRRVVRREPAGVRVLAEAGESERLRVPDERAPFHALVVHEPRELLRRARHDVETQRRHALLHVRLREELRSANAELERIKRRVATPKQRSRPAARSR